MVDSRVCNLIGAGGAAAGAGSIICCRRTSALQNERRHSACATHLKGLESFVHRSPSRIQRIRARNCQTSCKSLRLGAAEEGKSSWQDKLESSSTREGNILEGEAGTDQWRDRIVDKEGNIDNIEQEQICDEVKASAQWLGDQGGCLDDLIRPEDMLPTDQGQSQEGDKGEAVVGNVHVLPSHRKGEGSPTQFQEREKYGLIEAISNESFLARMKAHEHGGVKTLEGDELQQTEEEVFQEDEGRRPDDYQRRADLFGKSGEQFVAQKQRNERKSV